MKFFRHADASEHVRPTATGTVMMPKEGNDMIDSMAYAMRVGIDTNTYNQMAEWVERRGMSGYNISHKEGTVIDEQLMVRKVDNHYHIQIGCQETITHDKKEAMKWLGKMWDEFVAKGE